MPTYHPKVQLTQQLLQHSDYGDDYGIELRDVTISFEEMQSVAMPLLKAIVIVFPEVFVPDVVGDYNSVGFDSGDGKLFLSCQIRNGLPALELDINAPIQNLFEKKIRLITGLVSVMQIIMVAFFVERYKTGNVAHTKEKILRELVPILSDIITDVQPAPAPNT